MAKVLMTLAVVCLVSGVALGTDANFQGMPDTGTAYITKDGAPYLEIGSGAWGAGWAYMGMGGSMGAEDGATVHHLKDSVGNQPGAELHMDIETRATGPNELTCTYDLTTTKEINLIYAVIFVVPNAPFEGGTARGLSADGTTAAEALPMQRQGLGEKVEKVTLTDADGLETVITFEPAVDVSSDGALRVVLAKDTFKPEDPRHVKMTVKLPGELTYYPSKDAIPDPPGWEDWYPWQPEHDYAVPSRIGMEDWSAEPAGAKGRVVREGGRLLYDGEPIKLWGLNNCYRSCWPDKERAEKCAAMYRKYGVNTLRLHKYADSPGSGIQSQESVTRYNAERLDQMDYYVARCKEAGIFVTLSTQFGPINPGPADVEEFPYLKEFGSFRGDRIRMPHSSSYYSPEIQELHIRQTVNLLKHRNPYTGLTYAEDPCILAFEILNEQSILFYTSMGPLAASETLRQKVGKRFCDWLRERYGSQERLVEAWGEQALQDSFTDKGFEDVDQSLDKNNILPLGNPWYWDPANLEDSQQYRKRRLLDTLEFLYMLQNESYSRWVEAVREAGYDGEITASNWQAGQNYSHYYNLHSDYLVGMIDRHNYFGGWKSMLSVPGSGTFSSGMQQVVDRPFMLSEWIHTYPNEWGAEGPAIIGAYGLGLQDWDVSYMFENGDDGEFSDLVGRSTWDVTAPQIMGLFPAVARQVRRQDVRASEELAPRYVHMPSLREPKLGFRDRVEQQYDIKSFTSDKVPSRTLAVKRAVVEFTDRYRETPSFDPETARRRGAYVSTTGQLRWTPGENPVDGRFTMDTPATKAVVGFAEGEMARLGDVTITPHSRFAAIYVTAREPDGDLEDSDSLLVVAIARARNTGMKWMAGRRVLRKGGPPIRMEPVVADISIARRRAPTVHVLDHDGHRTGRTIPVRNGAFKIDGAAYKTPYYEIAYE